MTKKTPILDSTQAPSGVPDRVPPKPQTAPAEPKEVLGRHKNTGQKDHKGAR